MSGARFQLDHVVLLLPYKDLTNPPDWLSKNFIVSPGGVHADNKTENRLVLFRDGTYLELIAFINDDPARREGHWWDKPFGVVDYALTTPDKHLDYDGLLERLGKSGPKISYQKPQAGGRLKPDGTELKWEVTFPTGVERGAVPFFCHDVTPRERRIPITDENTNHPCGALGMSGILEQISQGRLSELDGALSAIVDEKSNARGGFEVGMPNTVSGLTDPTVRLEGSSSSPSTQDLSLSLLLQVPKKQLPDNIKQEIDGGIVSIRFERP